ncbi:hypothetical protein BG015_006702 [Linnemannia schmuckeri]|uniref:Uncharacterized protein n=1 Tax=Linnemannia schmuckeri TaxID=64567 RepID=A0A9P5S228_9FUNG|nr:hypothetical protein BG015_006702 [Linnemannia schmuckeri]
MRILSFSFGLAAIAFVTAQVADPLAASVAQNNYEWAPAAGQDLADEVEDLSSQISEIEFRANILSRLEQEALGDFETENACENSTAVIQTALSATSGHMGIVGLEPFAGSIVRHLQQPIKRLNDMVSGGGGTVIDPASITPTAFAFESFIQILKGAVSITPLQFMSKPILDSLTNLQGSVAHFAQCGAGSSKIAIDPSLCFPLADIYRGIIQDAVNDNPALNLPADASEDLKRLASGTLTILDLIGKNSIAATNEALLASRPIFAADILDQYRTELIRVTMDDEIKGYAVASLGTVVGVSNALEACLRVAADPVAAIDELNEELEAQAFYNDENEDEK